MRVLLLIALGAFLSSCSSDSNGYNRGYVISKSPIDTEKEAVEPEEADHH